MVLGQRVEQCCGAAILAQLLRADLLPEAWVALPAVRQLRALLRYRASQGGGGHVVRPHDRERGGGQVPAGPGVELGVVQARELPGPALRFRPARPPAPGSRSPGTPRRQHTRPRGAAAAGERAAEGQQRCDVDDRPGPAGDHGRQCRPGQPGDSQDVHRGQVARQRWINLAELALPREPGVVHQQAGLGCGDHLFHPGPAGGIGQVSGAGLDPDAMLAGQPPGQGLQPVAAAGGDVQVPAAGGQPFR
jgi:hypothetical protein